jgi:hypothetical protein
VSSTPASRLAAALVACACALVAVRAGADAPLAETLFQEAKTLMAESRFAEACPKLAESMRLDPGTGTLLALAVCHEGEGKTATAWAELVQVEAASVTDGREDRVTFARERLAALEPALSRLTVVVPPEVAALPGLRVTRNGEVLGQPAWGTATPIDPGEHVIEARATGRVPWSQTVSIGSGGDRRTIVVGPFLDQPETPQEEIETTMSPLRVAGFVVGGLGLVSVAVGAYFGVQAIDKSGDAEERCTPELCLDPEAVALNDEAEVAANVANVTIGLGAAALVAGIVLVIVGTDEPAAAVAPWVAPHAGGVVVQGSF